MAWLNNTAATLTIEIDGEDYSNELVSGQFTDGTIAGTGCIMTSGSLQLSELPGQRRLEDYRKTKFGRGKIVLLEVTLGEQDPIRHPRGYLYIVDSVYDMETRSVDITVGCQLFMHNLTDDIEALRDYTIDELPETATFADLSAAVAAEGLFLWQDRFGDIKKDRYFSEDGWGSNKEPEKWVSVRDYTALSVAPLSTGNAVPDKIEVTYTWTEDQDDAPPLGDDGKPEEQDSTVSSYYLEHPANLKREQKVCTTDAQGKRRCRTTTVNAAKRTFAVTKTSSGLRKYGAQGGSLSSEISITVGPAVEVNGSYYAERYAYELARANGGAEPSLKGLENIVQEKKEKTYTYGSGGEVVKTVEDTFKATIGAMTATDWRAGNAETGIIYDPEEPPTNASRGFLTNPPTSAMYLQTRITTEWEYKDDRTVETRTTIKSSAQCNGVGIYPKTGGRTIQNIDATFNGIESSEKRTSMGGLLNPNQPPRNPGTSSKVTKSATYTNESAKYYATDAGSIVLRGSAPFNNPLDSEVQSRERAAFYARTLRDIIEGDAAGIRVAETMRPEVLLEYMPGMAFSFYDTQLKEVIKLRMNATGWAFSPNQCIFSTDGVFIGVSNGTVEIPDNVDAPKLGAVFKRARKDKEDADEAVVIAEEAAEAAQEANEVVDEIEETVSALSIAIANLRGDPPATPDQIFDVEAPNAFMVTTSALPADGDFEVSVFADPTDKVFDVKTGVSDWFVVTVAEP